MSDQFTIFTDFYHTKVDIYHAKYESSLTKLSISADVKWNTQKLLLENEQDLDQKAMLALIDLFKIDVENAEIYIGFSDNAHL